MALPSPCHDVVATSAQALSERIAAQHHRREAQAVREHDQAAHRDPDANDLVEIGGGYGRYGDALPKTLWPL